MVNGTFSEYQGADVRTHVAVEIAIFSDTPLTVIRTAIGRQDEAAHDTFVSGNYILRTDRPCLGTKKEKHPAELSFQIALNFATMAVMSSCCS